MSSLVLYFITYNVENLKFNTGLEAEYKGRTFIHSSGFN